MKDVKSLARAYGGYISDLGGVIHMFFDEPGVAKKVAEILQSHGHDVIGVSGTQVQVASGAN